MALDVAATDAATQLGRPVSRSFTIELHGLSPKRRLLSPEEALDVLYLGPDRFFRIIDVSVLRVSQTRTLVFTRISGHTPGGFDDTWNTPPGAGPFKQLQAAQIIVD